MLGHNCYIDGLHYFGDVSYLSGEEYPDYIKRLIECTNKMDDDGIRTTFSIREIEENFTDLTKNYVVEHPEKIKSEDIFLESVSNYIKIYYVALGVLAEPYSEYIGITQLIKDGKFQDDNCHMSKESEEFFQQMLKDIANYYEFIPKVVAVALGEYASVLNCYYSIEAVEACYFLYGLLYECKKAYERKQGSLSGYGNYISMLCTPDKSEKVTLAPF